MRCSSGIRSNHPPAAVAQRSIASTSTLLPRLQRLRRLVGNKAGQQTLRHLCQASTPLAARALSSAAQPMSAELIDGKAIAKVIREELKEQVQQLQQKYGKAPGLAVVLVGERKDSQTYVRNKQRSCEEVGIQSFGKTLPEDASMEEVLKVVQGFNEDPSVHGILVQLPLPGHMDEKKVLDAISLEKDVDGFHPYNIGCLAMRGRQPGYVSCTPKGCMELLERSGVDATGKLACVVGRSNIVGTPTAMLLQERNATVTVVHSQTPAPAEICARADIVVAAIGKPEFVTAEWIKPGAVVIDVGINSVDDPSSKKGYRLVGDVKFDEVKDKASKITPVPGGVGPMTIAMLLKNAVQGATRAFEQGS